MFCLRHQFIPTVLLIKSLAGLSIDQALYYGLQCAFASCSWRQGRIQHCIPWSGDKKQYRLNRQWLQKFPVHVHTGELAFLFPQAHQMPRISIGNKSEPRIWKKEIINGEGYTKDICPCFVSENVKFFLQCQPSPWVFW